MPPLVNKTSPRPPALHPKERLRKSCDQRMRLMRLQLLLACRFLCSSQKRRRWA